MGERSTEDLARTLEEIRLYVCVNCPVLDQAAARLRALEALVVGNSHEK
jgi:hypothetical protein